MNDPIWSVGAAPHPVERRRGADAAAEQRFLAMLASIEHLETSPDAGRAAEAASPAGGRSPYRSGEIEHAPPPDRPSATRDEARDRLWDAVPAAIQDGNRADRSQRGWSDALLSRSRAAHASAMQSTRAMNSRPQAGSAGASQGGAMPPLASSGRVSSPASADAPAPQQSAPADGAYTAAAATGKNPGMQDGVAGTRGASAQTRTADGTRDAVGLERAGLLAGTVPQQIPGSFFATAPGFAASGMEAAENSRDVAGAANESLHRAVPPDVREKGPMRRASTSVGEPQGSPEEQAEAALEHFDALVRQLGGLSGALRAQRAPDGSWIARLVFPGEGTLAVRVSQTPEFLAVRLRGEDDLARRVKGALAGATTRDGRPVLVEAGLSAAGGDDV